MNKNKTPSHMLPKRITMKLFCWRLRYIFFGRHFFYHNVFLLTLFPRQVIFDLNVFRTIKGIKYSIKTGVMGARFLLYPGPLVIVIIIFRDCRQASRKAIYSHCILEVAPQCRSFHFQLTEAPPK